MKAGGLDTIGAYVFWIHHEEVEGQFDFSDRRNTRSFVQTAHEVGLKVLMRIGPWDHGECRNGGHPDWLLDRAKTEDFSLRSTDAKYLEYVSKWYEQVAAQLRGLFWQDGGPIFAVQVDNETPDWRYLLACRDLAEAKGITPPVFTKTGWPTPAKDYPKDYPMLPFFGGYQDIFWTNDMHEDPNKQDYFFGQPPSLTSTSGYTIPEGYPWLDIEIGGGMAVAYNHRPYMSSEDMPAAHLAFLATGVNALGYYMYHGGNNPHSTYGDDPERGLQESSFQPAGAKNPMPSLSYDFFAPLGEFGQPRRHYHQMRRLHLFVREFGSLLAPMTLTMPRIVPQSFDDTSTLRWAARSDGTSGFLFVNNYERLATLPAKQGIRFELHLKDGEQLAIPSLNSAALTIPSGAWAHWPFNLRVGPITLSWATAQVLTRISSAPELTTLVLVETEGVPCELAFSGASNVSQSSGTGAVEDGRFVVRGISPGLGAAATAVAEGKTLQIVVLSASLADSVWKGDLAGMPTVAVGDAELVLHDGQDLHLHVEAARTLWLLPAPASLLLGGTSLSGVADGVFARYAIPVPSTPPMQVATRLLRQAGAARDVPTAPSGKAQEPVAEDWQAAGVWALELGPRAEGQSEQIRLAVRYRGDAARVYAGETLLTDNWFTGYDGDGQMEVGLSYLEGEVPGIFMANLTVHVLPLRRDSVESSVFIRRERWPDFEGGASVAALDGVDALGVHAVTLRASHEAGVEMV